MSRRPRQSLRPAFKARRPVDVEERMLCDGPVKDCERLLDSGSACPLASTATTHCPSLLQQRLTSGPIDPARICSQLPPVPLAELVAILAIQTCLWTTQSQAAYWGAATPFMKCQCSWPRVSMPMKPMLTAVAGRRIQASGWIGVRGLIWASPA
jgi:hypothetical protein